MSTDPKRNDADDFIREAQQKPQSFARETVDFLLQNKKWWLTPIIVTLLVLGLLVALGGTAAAPFIYTLF